MEPNHTESTDENQVTSTINVAPKYVKSTSASNRQYPDEISSTEYGCGTEMFPPETEAQLDQELWTSHDDDLMDFEQNASEDDIRQFIENFKNFHTLMIQLNEPQYFATRMDVAHTSLDTDLLDLLGELAYRRGEEAEQIRQKAELDEILKSIQDESSPESVGDNEDESSSPENVGDNQDESSPENVGDMEDDDADDSHRIAMSVIDELLDIVADCNNFNNYVD